MVGTWHQEQDNTELLKSATILASQASKAYSFLYILQRAVIVLCFSRHLPATSWQPWGQKVSSFLAEKAQSPVAERISGPQDAEEAKPSLFPGASRPSPSPEDTRRRPRVTKGSFPRSGTFKGSKRERLRVYLEAEVLSIQLKGVQSPKINKPGI